MVPFTHVRWILNLGDPKSLASVVPALPCRHPHTDAHAFRKVKKKKKKMPEGQQMLKDVGRQIIRKWFSK